MCIRDSYNGVVFNEMKGALSDPMSVLDDAVNRALFPTTAYARESGGDPRAIQMCIRDSVEVLRAAHDLQRLGVALGVDVVGAHVNRTDPQMVRVGMGGLGERCV